MPATRHLLVCDPDPAAARALAPELRRRGWRVHAVPDAARALQLAILRSPDAVLLDAEAPLLDAATFMRILRTNPRTERIPVLVAGAPEHAERARVDAAGFVTKPLAAAEVAARADEAARRVAAARAGAAELSGSLAQMSVPDVLQVLAMSRKSGRLTVEADGAAGFVALAAGRIVDARLGRVARAKALHRIVALREGRFAFAPGSPPGDAPLDLRCDEAVLDGVRHADEVAHLAPSLPARGDVVALAVDARALPPDLHPVTAEVAALLASPRTVQDLLDAASASDLEALRALAALLERGLATRRAGAAGAAAPALLDLDAVHALRARLGGARVAKILLAGDDAAADAALARLAAVPGFTRREPAPLGTLAAIAVDPRLRIDLVRLPAAPALRPAWRLLAAAAQGAVALLPADEVAAPLAALARAGALPLVVCGPPDAPVPAALAPPLARPRAGDAALALAAVLAGG